MSEKTSKQVTRRQFMRWAMGATVAGVGASLLAACGATPTPAPAPPPAAAATTAPAAAATTAPAAAATTAPAAAATAAPAKPTAPPAAAKRGGTLTMGYAQKTSFANLFAPEFNAGGTDIYLRRTAFSGLVQVSQDFLTYIPDLAEKWEFSGNKCIFTLRKNVKWHDGKPFSAKDVLFSFRLIAHPNVKQWNGVGMIIDYIVGMKDFSEGKADKTSGITAPDDYTVVFEMTKPFREPFLSAINSFVMVPEHILGKIPEAQWALDESAAQGLKKSDFGLRSPIGTGPFKITRYEVDQFVEYEPYADYHRGKPLLDKLVYVAYTDALAMAAAVEKGECHIGVRMANSEFDRFKKISSVNIVINPGLANEGFEINKGRPYLADKRFRQALNYAVDKERIVKDFFYGATVPAQANIYYAKYGVSPKVAPYMKYDPAKATQLIKDAGWDPNRKLRILLDVVDPMREPEYEMIRDYWAKVGVKTEYQIVGAADYSKVVGTAPFDWDVLYSAYAWGPNLASATSFFRDPLKRFPDYEEGAAMWEKALLLEKDEDVKAAIWQLQEMLAEEQRYVFIAQSTGWHTINKKVAGFAIKPIYALWTRNDWGLEKLYLES
ncbi:MAG: ABC transporter substrate-binding protein [Chloroflexi bacterium]|nr:ABC transporter substrate-binding protein [Chloroflexota bacterium]